MSAIVRSVAGACAALLLTAPVSAQPKVYSGHEREVFTVAFSPNGQWLASTSYDSTIRLWDVARGSATVLKLGNRASSTALAFDPTGKVLATSGDARSDVQLWTVPGGQRLASLVGNTDKDPGVSCVAFSPDGRWLAVGHQGGQLRLWDTVSRKPVAELQKLNSTATVRHLAFSADGRTLAACCEDVSTLFDVATPRPRVALRVKNVSWKSLAFVPDGRSLVLGDNDGRLYRCDAATGKLADPIVVKRTAIDALAVTPDSKAVICCDTDDRLTWFELASGQRVETLEPVPGIVPLCLSPDGKLLAYALASSQGYDVFTRPVPVQP